MKEETCDETHKSTSFSKNTQSKGGKCQRNSSILISSSLRCETRSKKYRTRNGDDAIKGEKSYAPSQSSKGKSQKTFKVNPICTNIRSYFSIANLTELIIVF